MRSFRTIIWCAGSPLSWIHAELTPHYSRMGRPSIDPVLMIRMLLIGYVFAIRSERALCREVQVNLAYRWFCGLGIEDKIPDHSAFSRARNERFRDSGVFRRVFERVVEACLEAGLIGGEGFAVDASLIAADANKQRSVPGSEWSKTRDPATASRAVKEYLATLNDAAFGAATDVTPKFVSPSDPAAQWTGAMRGPAFFAYADNYLIDVKCGIIMDVEASRTVRQAEVGAAKTMIDRTEDRFAIRPERLAGDTAYGSAEMLNWLVDSATITTAILTPARLERPSPRAVRWSTTERGCSTVEATLDCGSCQFKGRSCPNTPARKIPRSLYEGARDLARSPAGTAAFEQSRRERKRVEMLFAHLKRILNRP